MWGKRDRMSMYRVHPTDPNVLTNPEIKPILVAHPYVLGSGILAFLPSDNKSYVHAFANQGNSHVCAHYQGYWRQFCGAGHDR